MLLHFHLFSKSSFKKVEQILKSHLINFNILNASSFVISLSKMFRPFSSQNFVQFSKNAFKNVSDIPVQALSTTSLKYDSFKVQDPKDFNERVKNSKVPVIVDFFASWCNPCRLLTPRLESVIAERKGKVVLAKVDVDENTDLALDYEVGSVPVILAMDNGEVIDKLVGLQDEDKLRKFVDKILRDQDEENEHGDLKKANPK